jgi:ParB family chromosome partitioning protein
MTAAERTEANIDLLKVSSLKFGHDKAAPGGGVNARSSGREDRIEELAASIASMGLLQPLAVIFDDGGVGFVVDGNRRLAALKALIKDGTLTKGHAVPVIVLERDADHREASLAANIVRLPLHPVDQFEAFSGLCATGLAPDEIASRFGVTSKLVKMRIALGDLAPEVRAAWREGTIGEEAARVLTLEKDKKRQSEVLAKLVAELSQYGGARQVNGWQIKQALGFTGQATAVQIDAVGRDAYIAAGGELIEDLFSDTVIIQHPEILAQLGEKAVDDKIEELQAEGWGFVHRTPQDAYAYRSFTPEAPAKLRARYDALEEQYNALDEEDPSTDALYEKLTALEKEIDATPIPAEKIPELGCFVEFDRDGLNVRRGLIPRDNRGQAERSSMTPEETAKPTDDAKASISKALLSTLSEQRTVAASRALANNSNLAVMALIASLETRSAPVRLHADAFQAVRPERLEKSFAERMIELDGMQWSKVMDALAAAVAGTLDLRTERGIDEAGCTTLIGLLGDTFEDETRKVFNARDYFERANATVIKNALVEMGVAKPDGKKADLVEMAMSNVSLNGWLPPELRLPVQEESSS